MSRAATLDQEAVEDACHYWFAAAFDQAYRDWCRAQITRFDLDHRCYHGIDEVAHMRRVLAHPEPIGNNWLAGSYDDGRGWFCVSLNSRVVRGYGQGYGLSGVLKWDNAAVITAVAQDIVLDRALEGFSHRTASSFILDNEEAMTDLTARVLAHLPDLLEDIGEQHRFVAEAWTREFVAHMVEQDIDDIASYMGFLIELEPVVLTAMATDYLDSLDDGDAEIAIRGEALRQFARCCDTAYTPHHSEIYLNPNTHWRAS